MTALPIPTDADIVPAPVSDGFTVAEFLDWVRTKPAARRYCYVDNGKCAIALFLIETGRSRDPHVGGAFGEGAPWCDNEGRIHFTAEEIATASGDGPWRFGALATRLQALLP